VDRADGFDQLGEDLEPDRPQAQAHVHARRHRFQRVGVASPSRCIGAPGERIGRRQQVRLDARGSPKVVGLLAIDIEHAVAQQPQIRVVELGDRLVLGDHGSLVVQPRGDLGPRTVIAHAQARAQRGLAYLGDLGELLLAQERGWPHSTQNPNISESCSPPARVTLMVVSQ
jgi:hypothetical protein